MLCELQGRSWSNFDLLGIGKAVPDVIVVYSDLQCEFCACVLTVLLLALI